MSTNGGPITTTDFDGNPVDEPVRMARRDVDPEVASRIARVSAAEVAAMVSAREPSEVVQLMAEQMADFEIGDYGAMTLDDAGCHKQTLKYRIKRAAALNGYGVKFRRDAGERVVFQITERTDADDS